MGLEVPIIDSIIKVIDKVIPDRAARDKAKAILLEKNANNELEEIKTSMAAILNESQSSDKVVSRARPLFLYLMYGIFVFCFIGAIIGIWKPDAVFQVAKNMGALLNAIPEPMWWLFGAGYLGYTGGRSFDKWKATQK
jgi:hypothetical protein